jgi:hypothetical protein
MARKGICISEHLLYECCAIICIAHTNNFDMHRLHQRQRHWPTSLFACQLRGYVNGELFIDPSQLSLQGQLKHIFPIVSLKLSSHITVISMLHIQQRHTLQNTSSNDKQYIISQKVLRQV